MLKTKVALPAFGSFPFLYRDDIVSDPLVMHEIFAENVYDMDPTRLAGGWVVDIGANIGAFSYLCARYGAKQILVVEPDHENLEVCQRNLEDFEDRARIMYDDRALWHEPTVLVATGPQDGNRQVQPGPGEIMGVPLRDLLAQVDAVDVLKIDCEGGEYNITEADVETLLRVRYLAMEFHTTDAVTFGCLVAVLAQAFNLHLFGNHRSGGMLFGRPL